MKFSLKDICVEFGGWSLEFARIRSSDFLDFRDEFASIPDDKYNEDGGMDIDALSRAEWKILRNVTPAFLAKNLKSAKCGEEEAETENDKLILIDFLSDDEGFQTFSKGYINGEKKT
jgi:hypothetical protein